MSEYQPVIVDVWRGRVVVSKDFLAFLESGIFASAPDSPANFVYELDDPKPDFIIGGDKL